MADERLSAEDRRLQILLNAGTIFARKGLVGARTRDIAEACGISEAVIYKHFKGKQELFEEFIAYHHAGAQARWEELSASAPDGLHALREISYAQVDLITDSEDLAGVMIHGIAASTDSEDMKTKVRKYFEYFHNFLISFIKRGIEDGSIRDDTEIQSVAWTIRSLVWSQLVFHMVGLDKIITGTSSKQIVQVVIDYIDPKKKRE
ncbi:MAG TPA: TetR/AcrR family transcriptional regulator [bacterium]|jgi:AcrR family transcriptional regulator